MGNSHSSEASRTNRSGNVRQRRAGSRLLRSSIPSTVSPISTSPIRSSYDLRQTVSRLRRNLSPRETNNLEVNQQQNGLRASVSGSDAGSVGSRRRFEETFADDEGDGSTGIRNQTSPSQDPFLSAPANTRRRRIEFQPELSGIATSAPFEASPPILADAEETAASTATTHAPAIYFSFLLEPITPSIPPTPPTTNDQPPTPVSATGSSRLQNAVNFLQNLWRRSPSSTTTTTATAGGEEPVRESTPTPPNLLVIRINPPTNFAPQDGSEDMFRYTIYFLVPRSALPADQTLPPPPLISFEEDLGPILQDAFSIINSIVTGSSYEDLLRLQEALGAAAATAAGSVNQPSRLSVGQIEEQLGKVPFRVSNVTVLGHRCPICLVDYQEGGQEDSEGDAKGSMGSSLRTLPCQHSYHVECIDQWLCTCNQCPLCRQPAIREEGNVNT